MILAGKDYWQWLVPYRLEFETPLDGLGVGERLRWLKQQTAVRPGLRGPRPSFFPFADFPNPANEEGDS